MENPTLWECCLFYLIDKAREEEKPDVKFADVDSLALEVSKHLTQEHSNWEGIIQHVWNTR